MRRVGGDRAIAVDVRVLAATRRDLDREVQAGRFRDDLFYRLAVARDRAAAAPRAGAATCPCSRGHFWPRARRRRRARSAPTLLARWEDYRWPGNVRELRNAVARHLALGELAVQAQERRAPARGGRDRSGAGEDLPLSEARDRVIEEFERRYVERVLARSKGVVTEAARASGVARRHFQRLRARSAR